MLPEADPGSPEFWAALTPDAAAVVHGDTVLTYREWNERADRVAEGLARLGLGQGDRMGMRFRLCTEWFVVQRALQKLGVAQVAVNWKLTAEEAAYIIVDSEAKGLVCDDADPAPWVRDEVGILVTVGQGEGSVGVRFEDLEGTPDAPVRFGPTRPSIVIYTSGTTGAPKGVPPLDISTVKDPERLQRFSSAVAAIPPYPDRPRVLMSLPVHHAAGPAIAVTVCAKGGTAFLLDPYDPLKAVQMIDEHRIQVWSAVPTMLLRIMALTPEELGRHDLTSLRSMSTGAAVVPQILKEWIVATFGDGVLWETYGTSESSMVTFMAPEHQLTKPGSSGIPFPGAEVAIVDGNWNRLPAGTTGEIAVNTPSVLSRYLGRDELGDDTVRDGFYRTGDVGHLDEDGFLFITDRIKDMIVAGGANIYPAEIEAAVLAHPAVAACAVIGIPHPDLGEQPMAFIVTVEGGSLTPGELDAFLEPRLAKYKRPRQVSFVDELPLNPMGKVLKNALRAPYWEGRERSV